MLQICDDIVNYVIFFAFGRLYKCQEGGALAGCGAEFGNLATSQGLPRVQNERSAVRSCFARANFARPKTRECGAE